ncbi:OprO/OprP family phosphate-selective porin [Qipengyuania sp. CAU 1752]
MNKLLLCTASLATLCISVPALAQDVDPAAMQQELATMRAQMQAMAQRIDALEGDLAEAKAVAEVANATAEAANISATQAVERGTAAKADSVVTSWKGAPQTTSANGWSFKPRGRLQYDAGFVSSPDSTGREDGFGNEVRRARLGVQGGMPGGFGYKFELDFDGTDVSITDAIIIYETGNVGLTVGQHNNFQGLEELTSSLSTSHLERAAFTDAFGFERRVGASLEYSAGDVIVQGGVFTDNISDLSNKNWGADGRVVFAPKLGTTQLHLGGSVHFADLETGMNVRYRQRPAVHFSSERFINTGSFGATSELGLGGEAAIIRGPFHATGEVFWQTANRPGALADPTFFGGYAEVGMFLTKGDSRGYKGGKFDRIKPKSPVGDGGAGALQVNLRYDRLDLSDSGIVGGTQDGLLASLIWSPTDYTRFMVGYAHLEYSDAVYPAAGGDTSYSVDSLGVRAQIDF